MMRIPHSLERSFPVRQVPDLEMHGPARRWWWGPFVFSRYPTGRIFGHVHHPEHGAERCGVKAAINAGDWR